MRVKRSIYLIAATFIVLNINPAWAIEGFYSYRDNSGVLHLTNVYSDRRFRPMSSNGAKHSKKKLSRKKIYSIIDRVSNKFSVDPALIRAIVKTESDFDPYAVSYAGAKGLMQLMPETARDLNVSNPFDAEENIYGGVKHFKSLMKSFKGDIALSVAAYNAGRSKVLKYGGIPPYDQTIRYVEKVITFYNKYKKTSRL